MSKDLGQKQKWMLSLAYAHEQRHDGAAIPIANGLDEAFFDYDREDFYLRSVKKSQAYQTRRAVAALIGRSLMVEAGTAVSETGRGEPFAGHAGPGRYYPKGYERICKTYALTDAGRVIGKAEHEATHAQMLAIEAANPQLEESAAKARAALDKI
jgi:hypothetical protein